jgi:hypothetical protein
MAKSHRRTQRRTQRKRGGGYQTSQQFFDPAVRPPVAGTFSPVISAVPTVDAIRPITYSTFRGGRRSTRRRGLRGGFSPSVMGGFIPNAQAAIVPAALYLVYHTLVPKSRGTRRN